MDNRCDWPWEDGISWAWVLGVVTVASLIVSGHATAAAGTDHQRPQRAALLQPDAPDKVYGANASRSCPLSGGLLDSISVPVNASIALVVQIGAPAQNPVSFQLRSRNPLVVAAGDRVQGFLPVVTVPAGQTRSNAFNLFGVGVGATTLDLIPLSAGFTASAFPTGAWDVNNAAGGSAKFVDANPPTATCRAGATPDISTSASVLATCGRTVQGVAADGVTQLLLRTLSGLPGTACFDIEPTSAADPGAVSTAVAGTQPVGALHYGFSLYRAPDAFDAGGESRKVRVRFTFTPSIGNANTTSFTADIDVLRPPVVLMHGLWSSPSAWDGAFVKNDAGRTTVRGDYKDTNAARFDTNVPAVRRAVNNALRQFRAANRAVTQVDVVGHSMGGILTRLYANSTDNVRPDNYGRGDVRRLITLSTPHGGSTLANLLVSLREVAPRRVDAIGGVIGSVRGGAVCDLAQNSPALSRLGATPVRGSAFIATGGTFPAYRGEIEFALTARVCNGWTLALPPQCNSFAYLFPQDRVDGFRFRQSNDQIVGITDQLGGVGGWSFPGLVHTSINTSEAVAQKAFELLDGPVSGLAAASFPAAASTGLGSPAAPPRGVPGLGAAQDQADYLAQCGPGGPMNPGSRAQGARQGPSSQQTEASSQVVVTFPAEGQQFAPGDPLTVVVQVDPALTVSDVVVGMPPVPLTPTVRTSLVEFTAQQQAPLDYAGPLTITPIALDADLNEVVGEPVTVQVVPLAQPASVAFAQRYFHLDRSVPTQPLRLIARYGPATPEIDVSLGASGTRYESSNLAVATVSADGVVQLLGDGLAVVTATHRSRTDQAIFVVESEAQPPAPQDVTAAFAIERGGFRLDRNSGFFVQQITVRNISALPVPGSAYLLIQGLAPGVSLVNRDGVSSTAVPGSPYLVLPVSADGRSLLPGASSTLTLHFLNPARTSIGYGTAVYRSSFTP